jgi:hypothetical protein
MEPFEKSQLSDEELNSLLREWEVPQAPARLRAAVLGGPPKPWWRRVWNMSIRVPVPLACSLMLLLGVGAWRWARLASSPAVPRVIIKTERVEIPVVTERVVTKTVYRDRPASDQLFPVAELRPRIIRREHVQN